MDELRVLEMGWKSRVSKLMEEQKELQMDELRVLEMGWKLRVLKLMEQQKELQVCDRYKMTFFIV